MDDNPIDRVPSLVAGHLHACLADLLKAGAVPRPEAASCVESGWGVVVVAFPALPGEGVSGLNQCDRDLLAMLAKADETMSADRLRRQLDKAGIGAYSLASIKRSLSRLLALKLVANSRRSPRGYYLPHRLPLFSRPVPRS
jgi:hypothetical protein